MEKEIPPLDALANPSTTEPSTQAENEPQKLETVEYSIAREFGMKVPAHVMFTGYKPGLANVPDIEPDYVFNADLLRDFFAFWQMGDVALKVRGDPSAGKTSMVEQFHARLRCPLQMVSATDRMEAETLIGRLMPSAEGGMVWRDGPVLRAARMGTSVLIDEYNLLDPEATTGLNMLMERYPYTVPETGEVVKPAKSFRVFATENSVTSALAVAGRKVQDVANNQRFMVTYADYLPPHLETMVVMKALLADKVPPDIANLVAGQVVAIANSTREAFRQGSSAIDEPLSTRVAIRWAKLIRRFQNISTDKGGPVAYALRRSFDMHPAMDAAVMEFVKAKLGT